MRFQRLKVLLIVIFVAVVLKCVAASPALSRLLMDTVNEEEEETHSPPPWAQANGHGKHFTNRLFFVKRIMFDYTIDILVSSFVQEVFFLRKTTDSFSLRHGFLAVFTIMTRWKEIAISKDSLWLYQIYQTYFRNSRRIENESRKHQVGRRFFSEEVSSCFMCRFPYEQTTQFPVPFCKPVWFSPAYSARRAWHWRLRQNSLSVRNWL